MSGGALAKGRPTLAWALLFSVLLHLGFLLKDSREPVAKSPSGGRKELSLKLMHEQNNKGRTETQRTLSRPAQPPIPVPETIKAVPPKKDSREPKAIQTLPAEAQASVMGEPAPAATEAQKSGAAEASNQVESMPGPAALSADALREYQLALGSAARSLRRYPALARSRGWQGRVVVRLSWQAGASEPHLQILKSSTYALLDEQARGMLESAAQQVLLPAALRHRSFSLDLPVEFSLEQP